MLHFGRESTRGPSKTKECTTTAASTTVFFISLLSFKDYSFSMFHSFKFCSFYIHDPHAFVEKNDKTVVRNAGGGRLDRALWARSIKKGSRLYVLSERPKSWPRQNTVTKEGNGKGNSIKILFLLEHYMRQTHQDCRSGPCKALPHS